MKKKKKVQRSKDDVLNEWMSWINSTNAEQLALAFEDWIHEQGYELTPMKEK